MNIAAADPADLGPILALLRSADLPVADITPALLAGFVVARDGADVVGLCGVEAHARAGLLRSLAVAPAQRGQRLGEALVAAAEAHARNGGVDSLTLLTTTAQSFFERLGYRRIDRADAPPALQATAEFARLCPSSAACLTKSLP